MLYQATLNVNYLEHAVSWQQKALSQFWDKQNNGFFSTSEDTDLILRPKEIYDSAIPSANSIMGINLSYLYQLTGEEIWQHHFDLLIRAFSAQVNKYPIAYTMLLIANDIQQGPNQHLVFTGKSISPEVLAPLKRQYLPYTFWLAISEKIIAKSIN